MSNIVVYQSGYGHTKKQAEAVLSGLTADSGVEAMLLPIDAEGNIPEDGWVSLAVADTIIFGSPAYMGSVSWQRNKFSDASSKHGQAKIAKPDCAKARSPLILR